MLGSLYSVHTITWNMVVFVSSVAAFCELIQKRVPDFDRVERMVTPFLAPHILIASVPMDHTDPQF